MATQCFTSATLTSTDVTTSTSLSTTTSISTTTAPPTITTSLFPTCVPVTSANITTCTSETQTSTITLPGTTALVTLPLTITVDVPLTSFITLFGTSCTTSATSIPPDPTTAVPPPPDTNSTTTSDTSSTTTSSTTTSIPITTSDTSTSSSITTSATATPSLIPDTTNGHKKSGNAGAIAGGVVGGVVALLLLGFLTWRLIKKQPRFDDIFNADKFVEPGPHYKKKIPEPKPYDYGVIGQQNAVDLSPPNSPPATHATFGNQVGAFGMGQGLGYAAGQSAGFGQGFGQATGHPAGTGQGVGNGGGGGQSVMGNAPGQGMGPGHSAPQPPAHIRNSSLTPLLAGVAAASAAGGANAVASGSSRPSSSSSMEPQVFATQQENTYFPQTGAVPAVPPSLYPPALHSWSAQQGFGQASGSGSNSQGYGPGPSMSQGTSSLAHNTSAGSSTAFSSSSWGTPSGNSTGYHGAIPTVVVGGGARSNMHQPHPSYGQYDDPFARSGSPVSVQEQRILQVRNADPGTPAYPPAGSARQSFAAPPSALGRTSDDGAQATTPPSSANRPSEKAGLVHLDGGLYQEPALPAYES